MGWTMQELGVHKAKQEFDFDGPKKKLAFDWDRSCNNLGFVKPNQNLTSMRCAKRELDLY